MTGWRAVTRTSLAARLFKLVHWLRISESHARPDTGASFASRSISRVYCFVGRAYTQQQTLHAAVVSDFRPPKSSPAGILTRHVRLSLITARRFFYRSRNWRSRKYFTGRRAYPCNYYRSPSFIYYYSLFLIIVHLPVIIPTFKSARLPLFPY